MKARTRLKDHGWSTRAIDVRRTKFAGRSKICIDVKGADGYKVVTLELRESAAVELCDSIADVLEDTPN